MPLPSMVSDKSSSQDDEFEDDDLDLCQLMEAVETAEKRHTASTTTTQPESRSISFVSEEPDPSPPPLLPASTPCQHKFDPENLRTWIYPVNYPVRGYQLNIVKKALFNNTLVALPTGLGKTFIAAVVMYNYYRWFPNSIILFMAPTRPLVEQQIEACHKICGLEDTTLLMGTTSAAKRIPLWQKNRVFFATPQTIEKDIESRQFPLEKVVCVVVDEAHRATGNYAYSVVIRKLAKKNAQFRVLALTATPGSTLDAVQDVITNLQITNIQIRTEDSMDIREFSHGKNIQNITVRLEYTEGTNGLLPQILHDYKTKVFQPLLDDLARKPSGVQMDADQATPFGLRARRQYFMATAKNLNNALKFSIFQLIFMAETMCRAYERLCVHGIGSFVETIDNKLEEIKKEEESGKKLKKADLAFRSNQQLRNIMSTAKRAMENPEFIGHPKIERMITILLDHFARVAEGEASKVMVFSSYRSSVTEICKVLDRHRPIIRCSPFVGQAQDKKGAKGLNQREQQEVIEKFKKDEINVIVATSIGEEGLDIGEVDLIICYDSESSPIRMLQRMGRTGRKRQGKCIMLLTPQEEKKYARAKEAYSKIQQLIARGANLKYHKPNPTVLPTDYKPTICRKVLTVRPYAAPTSGTKRKRTITQQNDYTPAGYLRPDTERAFIESFCDNEGRRFSSIQEVKDHCWPAFRTMRSLNKYIPLQAEAKSTYRVGHAMRTIRFTGLVNNMEYRILNPDESARLMPTADGSKLGSSQLVLPSKFKPSRSAPQGRNKGTTGTSVQRSVGLLDEDVADFMEQQNIGQIVGLGNDNLEEDSLSFLSPPAGLEPSKSADLSTALQSKPRKDKGKAKAPIRVTNDGFDSDFDIEFDHDGPHSLSWEPMLPDEFFADNGPTTERQRLRDKGHAFPSVNAPLVNQPSDEKEKEASASLAPTHEPPILAHADGPLPNGNSTDDEFDAFDDEFDIPLDLEFLEKVEASIIPGFNDHLEPVFAFEMAMDVQQHVTDISTQLWTAKSVPRLSERGMRVLAERQQEYKLCFGHYLPTSLWTEAEPSATKSSQEGDAMSGIRRVDAVAQTTNNKSVIVLDSSQPAFIDEPRETNIPNSTTHLPDNHVGYPSLRNTPKQFQTNTDDTEAMNQSEEEKEEFDDSFSFDIDDGLLANFFENRLDEDGPQAALPDFLNVEPSQSIIVDKKKSLYYSNKPAASLPRQNTEASTPNKICPKIQAAEPSDDIIFEFNFETDSLSDDIDDENSKGAKKDGTSEDDITDIAKGEATGLDSITSRSPSAKNEVDEIVISDSGEEDRVSLHPNVVASPVHTPPTSMVRNHHSLIDLESSPLQFRTRKNLAISNDDEQGSPQGTPLREGNSLLLQLAKGQQSPSSPRSMFSDPESSPIIMTRRNRKRPLIEASEDSQQIPFMKQAKESESLDDLSQEDSQRLKQHRRPKKRHKRYDSQFLRQFIDNEAERSSDGGHTTDAEGDEGSSLMKSFIDDNSSVLDQDSRLSLDEEGEISARSRQTDIYAKSLLQSPNARIEKHWMNKFNADKWLNVDAAEDSIVGSEGDYEQEDDGDDLESIQDFASDEPLPRKLRQNIFQADDDDDFV